MRTPVLWSIALVCVPLYPAVTTYNEHEVTTDSAKPVLPGSAQLNERIGRPGFYEKKYGTIKFVKKQNDDATLVTLAFQWQGPKLTHHQIQLFTELKGTLFKKPMNGSEGIVATREHQVAEGSWNKEKQQLIFSFKPALPLHGTTTFFIVFTMNPDIEKLLAQGSFSLVVDSLPEAFQSTKK